MSERFMREQALAIFGMTEAELAELEASDGYEAAKAAAKAEREAFIEQALRIADQP